MKVQEKQKITFKAITTVLPHFIKTFSVMQRCAYLDKMWLFGHVVYITGELNNFSVGLLQLTLSKFKVRKLILSEFLYVQ